MSDLNTVGLNGKGKYVAAVADHALLVLLARLMAVFGVPVALFLFVQVWEGQVSVARAVATNTTTIAVHEQQIDDNSRRLSRLEARADRGGP